MTKPEYLQCRELELLHHDKLTETALLIMEKVVKNELEEELPEDLRLVYFDILTHSLLKILNFDSWT